MKSVEVRVVHLPNLALSEDITNKVFGLLDECFSFRQDEQMKLNLQVMATHADAHRSLRVR